MDYEIRFDPVALEQLEKLDRAIRAQILRHLERLAKNPELAKPLSNAFKNYRSEHVGKYHVLFSIIGSTLLIAKIEQRDKIYR